MKSPLQQLLLSRGAEPVIFAAEYSQLGHISSPRKKKKVFNELFEQPLSSDGRSSTAY